MDELSTTPSMNDPTEDVDATTSGESTDDTSNPRRWKKSGWIANVVKNLDDDGWAVEMIQIGAEEPALVGPWTMGATRRTPSPSISPRS
jgi:hypothetical protein